MNDAGNWVTIIQSIPQWGWATLALVLFGALFRLGYWLISGYTVEFQTTQRDNNTILHILRDGARVPDSDPPRYVGLAEIKADVIGNREIANVVTGQLIDKCAGMRCPLHTEILDELKDFSARAETSRAETKILVQGIADDVRTVNEHTFPLIAEIVRLVKNGSHKPPTGDRNGG